MIFTRRDKGRSAYAAGLEAEQKSCDYLVDKGCIILARRCRTPCGEIDIVAASATRLIFVEVKQRRTLDDAAFALTPAQQRRLVSAADYLVQTRVSWRRNETRFDVALHDSSGHMRWLADVLRAL